MCKTKKCKCNTSCETVEKQISLLRELCARWGMDGSDPSIEDCIEVLKKQKVE